MRWIQTIKAEEAKHVNEQIKKGIYLSPQEYIRKLIIKDIEKEKRKVNKIKKLKRKLE